MTRNAFFFLLTLFLSRLAMAQPTPAPKTYTYLIYHKLSPGLTVQDALPVEREWKTLNQAAVSEGNLIGWYMMTKQMSSNPNPAEYDYVTVIVTNGMNIKGASPAAMTKIYGDSVQARMASLQKRDRATAPVVKMEIWETVDAVFSPTFSPAQTPTVVLSYMRLRDPAADFRPLVSSLKQMYADRVKQNTMAGWDLSALVVPNGSEKSYSLVMAQAVPGMTALTDTGGDTAGAMQARSQSSRLFDTVRQEVFRIMEFTTR